MKRVISKRKIFGIAVGMMSVAMLSSAMGEVPVEPRAAAEVEVVHVVGAAAVAMEYDALNAKDENGDTALLRATKALDVEAVRRLLDLRVNPNVCDKKRYSSFWYACMGEMSEDPDLNARRKKILKLLYRVGADDSGVRIWDLRDEDLETMILIEVEKKKEAQEMRQVYDVLERDEGVFSVTHLPTVVRELVRGYGGNGSTITPHPLKMRSVVERSDWDDYLYKAWNRRNRRDMLRALYAGANPSWRHEHAGYASTLHQVVGTHDGCETLELFLACGADIEVRNSTGSTPLHWAALCNYPEMVTLLLQHGALVDAQDNEGKTPLDYAKRNRRADVVTLLKKHGARTKNRWCVNIVETSSVRS